jgi:hypothetical protein
MFRRSDARFVNVIGMIAVTTCCDTIAVSLQHHNRYSVTFYNTITVTFRRSDARFVNVIGMIAPLSVTGMAPV